MFLSYARPLTHSAISAPAALGENRIPVCQLTVPAISVCRHGSPLPCTEPWCHGRRLPADYLPSRTRRISSRLSSVIVFSLLRPQVKGGEVCLLVPAHRVAAQAVAVPLRFHHEAIILAAGSAADLTAAGMAAAEHGGEVLQDTPAQLAHHLAQLLLEFRGVQILRTPGPPGVPEFLFAAPEVDANVADSPLVGRNSTRSFLLSPPQTLRWFAVGTPITSLSGVWA